MGKNPHREETLRALRQICRGTAKSPASPADERERLSMGLSALDSLLPDRGLRPGSLVEWLAHVEGCGAAVLALQGVRPALQRRAIWAVVDDTGEFYPPAVRGWGLSLETLLWLRPSSPADMAWTVEQCLRCPAVGVTWFQAGLLPDRVLQRWKIAAQTGGGIGVLFRPLKAVQYASWADVRWLVQRIPTPSGAPLGRPPRHNEFLPSSKVRVKLLFCRGECRTGELVELEMCDATGDVRVVSAMAGAASAI